MAYDPEYYLLRIKSFLVSNLNTQIATLNAEKAAAGLTDPVLASVSNDAFFVQTLNDTVANYNPHVFISLDDVQSQGDGPGIVKSMTFSALIIVADTGQDLSIGVRMLRYLRVFEDLFAKSFDKLIPHANFKTQSIVPIVLTRMDTNDPYRAVGITLVTELG